MFWRKLFFTILLLMFYAFAAQAAAKKKVLLVGQGPDGHPKETHEYMAGVRVLEKCLAKVADLEITVVKADEAWKEGPDLLGRADAVVLFVSEGAQWIAQNAARQKAFANLAARRAGIVVLHWAMGTRDPKPIDDFLQLAGGCHGGKDRKYKVAEVEAQRADHPITAGIKNFKVRDEFYYRLKFVKPDGSIKPILQVPIDGNKETVAWAWQRPKGGRSFGFSGLHFHANWRLKEYRRLVAQGVLWSLKMPIPKEGMDVEIPDADFKLK